MVTTTRLNFDTLKPHVTIRYDMESYKEKAISFQLCTNDSVKLTQKNV